MYNLLLELFAYAMQKCDDFDEPEKPEVKDGGKKALSYYPKKKMNQKVKIRELLRNKSSPG